MTDKPVKARATEIVVFSSSEFKNDVQEFQDGINSWLKSQPDNIVIEDIIYRHTGSREKDVFSVAIISRAESE